MATLTIRKLDDAVYESLRAQAKANNRSIEAEARKLLGEQLSRAAKNRAWSERLHENHRAFVAEHGFLADSTPLIRQIREEEE